MGEEWIEKDWLPVVQKILPGKTGKLNKAIHSNSSSHSAASGVE